MCMMMSTAESVISLKYPHPQGDDSNLTSCAHGQSSSARDQTRSTPFAASAIPKAHPEIMHLRCSTSIRPSPIESLSRCVIPFTSPVTLPRLIKGSQGIFARKLKYSRDAVEMCFNGYCLRREKHATIKG